MMFRQYFHIFLLIFALLGLSGQSAAVPPCPMDMNGLAIMEMPGCEKDGASDNSMPESGKVNCAKMLQCSPAPLHQADEGDLIAERPLKAAHLAARDIDALVDMAAAPEFKPPKSLTV